MRTEPKGAGLHAPSDARTPDSSDVAWAASGSCADGRSGLAGAVGLVRGAVHLDEGPEVGAHDVEEARSELGIEVAAGVLAEELDDLLARPRRLVAARVRERVEDLGEDQNAARQ